MWNESLLSKTDFHIAAPVRPEGCVGIASRTLLCGQTADLLSLADTAGRHVLFTEAKLKGSS